MKNDKEEYRTTYIGGSRNFLLIKYADSKKEYPYMVYIDYEKGEGWHWSVKCRNINQNILSRSHQEDELCIQKLNKKRRVILLIDTARRLAV